MSTANATNGRPSAKARPNAPPRTEDELLRCEAAEAHAAIVATLADLKRSLGQAADVRVWTQRHPWPALGAAAAAGVVAGAAIRSAGGGNSAADAEEAPAPGQAAPPGASRFAPRRTIFSALFDLAATSLQHLILGVIQAHVVGHAAGDAVHEAAEPSPQPAAAEPH
jgi:hypothetical protein